MLLRTALVNSMNIPAVKTFIAVGIEPMAEWVKKLGLSTPMNRDFSAALGSSCVYPFELAGVYATFNRLGSKKPTYFTPQDRGPLRPHARGPHRLRRPVGVAAPTASRPATRASTSPASR